MKKKERLSAIKECNDFESAALMMADLDLKELSSQNYLTLGRKLESLIETPDLKIAYLTDFTVDLLPSYVTVFAANKGLRCGSYVGPYNQYYQEILQEDGAFEKYEPDIIFLSLTMKQLAPEVVNSFSSLSHGKKQEIEERIVEYIANWISLVNKKFRATVLLSNFPLPAFTQKGITDSNDEFGEISYYQRINLKLTRLVHDNQLVYIYDLAKLSARFGSDNVYDAKMYYIAKMAWSERFMLVVAEEIIRYVIALQGMTCKCIVLDLDNTLWGGIAGEDGPEGIKIGEGDPVSKAYMDFQFKIKSLKDRGILLAICSKNNEADVLDIFDKRSDMPLKLSDFAAMKINWDSKHINIPRLAKDLNIGIDSMVFIDDNPAECSLVRQMLPEVKTFKLPEQPEMMPAFIDHQVEFEKIIVLDDDIKKTEQYHQNKKRTELKQSIGDLNSYFHSLKTSICIREALIEDMPRIYQLFTKTNQFNTTTIRYSMGDIERFLNEDGYEISVISASDRFGDLGIIGLYLLELTNTNVRIDSFILSCRAMGRGIENAIMNHIKQKHQFNEKKYSLHTIYKPTPKNRPVKNFYEEQGFKINEITDDGEKRYSLSPENSSILDCSWIKVLNG